MANKKFNPSEWSSQPSSSNNNSTNINKNESAQPVPFASTDNLSSDIQSLVEQIEASSIDITVGYDHWRDICFALVEALGEDGRDFFHRLSRFNASYDQAEADKQYSACLRSCGSGITPRTLFHIAQQHGITLRKQFSCTMPSSVSPESSVSPFGDSGDFGETEDLNTCLKQMEMPTFSDKVGDNLPSFLRQVISKSRSVQDADMLILGTLTVISACIPNVSGLYDDREVYPNLFLFVTAQASAGKGRLSLCRHIVQPIHDRLASIYEAEMTAYASRLAEHAANKDGSEPPQKPPRRVLFIPANTSSTKFYKTLKDNGETGIMFETEGDTLVNAFKSDYGNYSDGFRKAFHHESITYSRVKDDEYTEIRKPRLSVLLSGTPRQIQSLIPDAENGLFSRFIFYSLNVDLQWHDVFANANDTPVDDFFRQLGKDFYSIHQALLTLHPLSFFVTKPQQQQFHDMFQEIQDSYIKLFGYDFLASVRRLGLITFRIAMILTVLRIYEFGEFKDSYMSFLFEMIYLQQIGVLLHAKPIITAMINYQFFPRSQGVTPEIKRIIECFNKIEPLLEKEDAHRVSNDVLALVRPHLESIGFSVETGKGKEDKIDVPVLFGENNAVDKSFYADALSADGKIVIEVEAGRAVRNNQFLKDIFQACMMFEVEYLVIAVLNEYKFMSSGRQMVGKDYQEVKTFLETLYVSNRLRLPLKGILLIGY